MARNYYCLVAGLRELALDSERKGFDARELIDSIKEELTKSDRAVVDVLYTSYDIANIVSLKKKLNRFSILGNLDRQQMESQMVHPDLLPSFMARIVSAFNDPDNAEYEDVDHNERFERALYESYYQQCAKSSCRMLRDWSRFDRMLRNICAATAARKQGTAVADVVVGHDEAVETMSRSAAADFGLKIELDWAEQAASIVTDSSDLLERELKLDRLRWDNVDEMSTFDYFDLNAVVAYLIKVNIVHRWTELDAAQGRAMFHRLTKSLSGEEALQRAVEEVQNS